MRRVPNFVDVGGVDGPGEARPAGARVELVGRSEQRLARHDVDVDARFLVMQILPGSGDLGAALLRYAILLRGELRDRVAVFGERLHSCFLRRVVVQGAPARAPSHRKRGGESIGRWYRAIPSSNRPGVARMV